MFIQLCLVVAVLGYLARCQTLHTGVSTWTPISYTRDTLLALHHDGPPPLNLPVCVRPSSERNRRHRRHRRRGQRGGIRQRLRRRGNRPPLPAMILCNARSLHGKMEELRANSKACFEYRTSSLMVFTQIATPRCPERCSGVGRILAGAGGQECTVRENQRRRSGGVCE